MSIRFASLFCAIVALGLASPIYGEPLDVADGQSPTVASRPPLAVAEIAKRNTSAVVTITTDVAQGSGVIVSSSGLIFTNLHVLRGATKASVKLSSGDSYDDIRIIDVDEKKDLLLLKIKAVDLSAVTLGNSESVSIGDRVVMISNPRGLDRTVSEGVISAIRDQGGYRLFQTTAPASPGSSGGGLFNTRGELVAITSAKLTDGENLNFCIPVNYARGMVPERLGSDGITLAALAQRFPAPSATGNKQDKVTQADLDRYVEKLLAEAKRAVRKVDDGLWSTTLTGKNAKIAVSIVATAKDGITFGYVSALVKKNPSLSVEDLKDVLRKSYASDFAKAGIDENGNLYAMQELDYTTLESSLLDSVIQNVGALADELFVISERSKSDNAVVSLSRPSTGREKTLPLLSGHWLFAYDASFWQPTSNAGIAGALLTVAHNNELWGQVLTENVQLDPNDFAELALKLAEKDGKTKAKVVSTRRLRLRNTDVGSVELEFKSEGITFRFIRYLVSDTKGSVEISVWTSSNLMERYREVADDFVAGLTMK